MRCILFCFALALTGLFAACNKPDAVEAPKADTTKASPVGSLLRIDSTFAARDGFSCDDAFPNVLGIFPAPGGKIYVTTPESSTYQGMEVSPVCRINPDGTLDRSFDPRSSFSDGGGRIFDLKTLSDGQIAVVGTFRVADAQGSYNIAVLNPDGSLDAKFLRSGPGAAGAGLFAVVEDSAGRLWAGGNFTSVDGVPSAKNLVAFDRTGAVDATVPWPDVNGRINSIVKTATGVWIGGEFTKVGGQASPHVAILSADGSLQRPVDLLQNIGRAEGGVRQLAPAPGGKMYAMGAFSYSRSGQMVRNLARITADARLDPDFGYANGLANVASNRILCGAVTAAGNLIVGGDFPYAAGGNIGMIDADGSVDKRMTAVNGGTGDEAPFVNGIYIDPSKRVYLVGFFSTLEGKAAPGIVRLAGND